MCTAVSLGRCFGRTLDFERSFGEEVVFTPRRFALQFRQRPLMREHFAILGMARVEAGEPLYFDAMNEHGLCMAGLNFTRSARYGAPGPGTVAAFELIPWVLGQCTSAEQARSLLEETVLSGEDFSPSLSCARLHWMLADRERSITVEPLERGLRISENPAGVLTNEPPFDVQMLHLANFMHLSPLPPENRFPMEVTAYSRGLGAVGLPGDLSSPSRFVRAAFTALHSVPGPEEPVSRMFHILDTVRQVRGCCRLEDGSMEVTRYSSCCDTENRVYCYTTSGCRRICGVAMDREELDADTLKRYPLRSAEDILLQN